MPQDSKDQFPPLPGDIGFGLAADCPGAPADAPGFDWSFIDQAYCLNLRSRADRRRETLEELAKVGLVERTTFVYSDPTSPKPPAIFHSHRAAAVHARAAGCRRILILEDDVHFSGLTARRLSKIRRQVDSLPEGWRGFYLGHFPLKACFVQWGVLRTSSGCSHAYVASEALIEWLRDCDPLDPGVPLNPWVGKGIDAALACVPRVYATFPMVALQSGSQSSNINPHFTISGKRRGWFDRYRWIPVLIQSLRQAEVAAFLLSPVHWMARGRWMKPDEL